MSHSEEVNQGNRFEFGKNWTRFLSTLNPDRIAAAELSLKQMLGVENLEGKSFLDIGSGSGLFSLAARRLGARVHSFDFDPHSVACTKELRRRYFGEQDPGWVVEEGSALDARYVGSLGLFDVVYSWGVLHHTGDMWTGLRNADLAAAPGSKLFIALYNDTGTQSRRWGWIKKKYNETPAPLKPAFVVLASATLIELKPFLRSVATLKVGEYLDTWKTSKQADLRGMSKWHDLVDWVGGYPYEYCTPGEIFDFYTGLGYRMIRLSGGNVGLGCHQYVFEKLAPGQPSAGTAPAAEKTAETISA